MIDQKNTISTGWEEKLISEVAYVNKLLINKYYQFNEIEYIDVASVEERRLTQTQKLKIENAPTRAKRIINDNDFLISTVRPNLKHFCFIKKAKPNLIASTGFAVISAKKNISDAIFLYYLLTSNDYTSYLVKVADNQTSTYPAFNPSIILNSKMLLPPLPEQISIGKILSSLDNKIELLQEQNRTLEEITQAIFNEWFVKLNFPGFKGDMIDSDVGKIPKGWRVANLSDEIEIIMGQSPRGESYNEIGEGMVFFQGRTDFQERFPKTRLYTTEPKRVAEKFDILVSVRAPVGDINVASVKCCIGRGLAAVRSNFKSYALYKIKSLEEEFKKFESEGTVFGSINKDSFNNIKTIIPDKSIVEKFDTAISSLDKKYYNNYCQIETLSNLRDLLLPKLMNGEIRVKL